MRKSIPVRGLKAILCSDCRVKVGRKYNLKSWLIGKFRKIRHHRKGHHKRRSSHHLGKGIHYVMIRGNKRKVNVLASGKWRFMKG